MAVLQSRSNFELDSWGRKVFPVKSFIIQEDEAIRMDLGTLEALGAIYDTPHFVIRDTHGIGSRVWSLHFINVHQVGLVIAYAPPEKPKTESEQDQAATKLQVPIVFPPPYSTRSVHAAPSFKSKSVEG